jgi:hypothetical protein
MHQEGTYTAVNWTEISNLGLLQKINKEIMHPLGLAIYRQEDGTSHGALVADDGVWEFSPDVTIRILSDEDVVTAINKLLNREEVHENINS